MNRNDKLLIAGMLLAAALFFLLFSTWGSKTGSVAVIRVGGEEVSRIPLDRDGAYPVEGKLGESIIRIEEGSVRVETAPCPDLICVRHSAIRYQGEQIVCLPGRMIIEILGDAKDNNAPVIDGVAE